MNMSARARIWINRSCKLTILFFIVILIAPYGCDVANRLGAHECKRESDGNLYIGEMCYLSTGDSMVFRLYDAKSGELLAERTYNHPEPKIIWSGGSVIYDTSPSDGIGYVDLPPTRWDRLRARLP
ncbi:hypothetical protein P3W85_38160 [Cupriavidus basilensis]|uniref:Uncharacterized protein n=1 Tax=Cupriavidus basilensis TaxID=68895 RepID=A0ABT6B1W7_9BURK|nr:hypothetical protein [Cupriavidus basilensis]MDF3838719.1 hypothetical protein [Cupriavidus basilensis]